jgi:hypothetical protein
MFRRRFLKQCRKAVDLPDVGLIPEGQWANAVERASMKAAASFDGFALPANAMESKLVGAIFDGHLIKQFREWLSTPMGQFFLQVLKAIAAALIAALIAGT